MGLEVDREFLAGGSMQQSDWESNPSVQDGAHWDQMKDEIGSLCMTAYPAGLEINTSVIFSSECQSWTVFVTLPNKP